MSCGKAKADRQAGLREQLAEMYDRVLAEHGEERALDTECQRRAAGMLLTHRLAQCTHAGKCGRLCPHLVKAPGAGMTYCVGYTFPDSPPPPAKHYVDDLGRIFSLYEALADPNFACPLRLF